MTFGDIALIATVEPNELLKIHSNLDKAENFMDFVDFP